MKHGWAPQLHIQNCERLMTTDWVLLTYRYICSVCVELQFQMNVSVLSGDFLWYVLNILLRCCMCSVCICNICMRVVCVSQCRITTSKKTHVQQLQSTMTPQNLPSGRLTVVVLAPMNRPRVMLVARSRYQQHRCYQLHLASVAQSASASAHPLKLTKLPAVLHAVLRSRCQTEVGLLSVCRITFCTRICRMQLGLSSGYVRSFSHFILPVRLRLRHHSDAFSSYWLCCCCCSFWLCIIYVFTYIVSVALDMKCCWLCFYDVQNCCWHGLKHGPRPNGKDCFYAFAYD